MTCCAHAQPKIRKFFMVARQQGRETFFKVARRVMNESSYLFHYVQPIRTKSSLQVF